MMQGRVQRTALLATTMLLGLVPVAAQAQAPTASAPPTSVDEIVVTGTQIRGVAPVGSSVIAIDNAQLQKSPGNTVTELLRSVPQIMNIGADESQIATTGVGNTNVTRGNAVNLRGLGPNATLALVDGRRIARSAVNGGYTDPSGVPSIAVERIEVVPDGASAIYGSDAVAGVVNFVLKKHVDGIDLRARYGVADGYDQRQLAGIGGLNWDGGGLVVAVEHDDHSRLSGNDRSWYRSDLRSVGGLNYSSPQCDPGNIVIGGVYYPIPVGGVTPATASALKATPADQRNFCEMQKNMDLLPKQERNSLSINVTQDVGDRVHLFAQGILSKRTFGVNFSGNGSLTEHANLAVPKTNAFFVAPTGLTPATETVEYNFINDLGGILNTGGYSRFYDLATGARVDLGRDWNAELSGTWSRDDENYYGLGLNSTALSAGLASSDPTKAIDPYGLHRTNPSVLAGLFNQVFNPVARNISTTAQLKVDGPLFTLPGGAVKVAAGLAYDNEGLFSLTLRGPLGAVTSPLLAAHREIKSGFVELFVPIFGADNARPGLERLELSLAGRYDDYSDVGSTTNPKLGVNWSPVQGLMFRGSYGKSFRAPNMADIPYFAKVGAGINVATGVADSGNPKGVSNTITFNPGNPNLQPEKATTWSFGGEYKPPSIPGLTVGATWFSVDYTQLVATPLLANALNNPSFSFLVTRNPTQAQIAQLLTLGLPLVGTIPTTVDAIVDLTPRNLGGTKAQGFDFQVSYRHETDAMGVFTVGAAGTYITTYDIKQNQNSPAVSTLNTITYPKRLKARSYLDWNLGDVSATVFVNYVNGYDNNQVAPVQKVRANTTVDLSLAYDVKWSGLGRALEGMRLSLDASNIFDRDPPLVLGAGAYDPTEAPALGRMVVFGVSKHF
jgi:iron complex outermembrane receptor protein